MQCRVTAFTVGAADVIVGPIVLSEGVSPRKASAIRAAEGTSNPYLTARGYRYCQGNCSTIPRPLTEFGQGEAKKCLWCLSRQAGKARPGAAASTSPQAAKGKGGKGKAAAAAASAQQRQLSHHQQHALQQLQQQLQQQQGQQQQQQLAVAGSFTDAVLARVGGSVGLVDPRFPDPVRPPMIVPQIPGPLPHHVPPSLPSNAAAAVAHVTQPSGKRRRRLRSPPPPTRPLSESDSDDDGDGMSSDSDGGGGGSDGVGTFSQGVDDLTVLNDDLGVLPSPVHFGADGALAHSDDGPYGSGGGATGPFLLATGLGIPDAAGPLRQQRSRVSTASSVGAGGGGAKPVTPNGKGTTSRVTLGRSPVGGPKAARPSPGRAGAGGGGSSDGVVDTALTSDSPPSAALARTNSAGSGGSKPTLRRTASFSGSKRSREGAAEDAGRPVPLLPADAVVVAGGGGDCGGVVKPGSGVLAATERRDSIVQPSLKRVTPTPVRCVCNSHVCALSQSFSLSLVSVISLSVIRAIYA